MERSVLQPFVEKPEVAMDRLVQQESISPPPLTQKHSGSAKKNLGFIPMLNDDNDDVDDSNSPKDNLIRRKRSPDGINDISIINKTANTNVSMNTTGLDLLNKLHFK